MIEKDQTHTIKEETTIMDSDNNKKQLKAFIKGVSVGSLLVGAYALYVINQKNTDIGILNNAVKRLKEENKRLINLCEIKDSFFKEAISDGLRKGSSLAGKHMADRKAYLNNMVA